jgi:SAM-dependent methyltransferase
MAMRGDEVRAINRDGWDRRVAERDVWSRPVTAEETGRARLGDWSVVLTPNKPVPRDWFGAVAGRDILCLASGGGQQGPILAAAGARVVVFDASPGQLAQDEMVAHRDGLDLVTRQGFMHDLSAFPDERFDLIFHPVSNCYAPEIEPVWRECFRVLRPGGVLLAGFMNPVTYIFDLDASLNGDMVVRFPLPYADVTDLPPDELQRRVARGHTVEFSHTLETQIAGQLKAGFVLTHLFEDTDLGSPDTGPARYFPTMIATRALKL